MVSPGPRLMLATVVQRVVFKVAVVHPCQPERGDSKGEYKRETFYMCPAGEVGKLSPFTEFIVTLNEIGFCYKNKVETRTSCLC